MGYKKYAIEEAIEIIKVAPAVMGVSNFRLSFFEDAVKKNTRVNSILPVMLYRFDVCESLQRALDQWSVGFPGQTPYIELAIDSDGVVWIDRPNIEF
jgi:hypothetical protein